MNIPNLYGTTPLFKACTHHHMSVVKILINAGADLNATSQLYQKTTPLMNATACNNKELVELLVRSGADVSKVDAHGATALHMACSDVDICEILINAGASVNSSDNDGWTPLHHSILEEDFEVAEYLISCGADIFSKALISNAVENVRNPLLT
jgi:ankyrin repeat protein